jgi:hypothetical protein
MDKEVRHAKGQSKLNRETEQSSSAAQYGGGTGPLSVDPSLRQVVS